MFLRVNGVSMNVEREVATVEGRESLDQNDTIGGVCHHLKYPPRLSQVHDLPTFGFKLVDAYHVARKSTNSYPLTSF